MEREQGMVFEITLRCAGCNIRYDTFAGGLDGEIVSVLSVGIVSLSVYKYLGSFHTNIHFAKH